MTPRFDENHVVIVVMFTILAGVAHDIGFAGTSVACGLTAAIFGLYIFVSIVLRYLGPTK
jgi:hypothetical protein